MGNSQTSGIQESQRSHAYIICLNAAAYDGNDIDLSTIKMRRRRLEGSQRGVRRGADGGHCGCESGMFVDVRRSRGEAWLLRPPMG
jgi:hypothetical protein